VSGGFIEKLAGPLKATPYRIAITGHTSASKTPSRAEYGPWNLSADRANMVRQILEAVGMPSANFYAVPAGPTPIRCCLTNPFIAANRRVTITLMREGPPVPPDLKPQAAAAAVAPRRCRRQLTALAGRTRRHRPLAVAGVNAFALQNS
jgi:hypothetical protein